MPARRSKGFRAPGPTVSASGRQYGYHMLGNWEDAREAAQDMFVKAFQAIEAFDISKSFSTWIYRILINTCIDYRRRRAVVTAAFGITPFSTFNSDRYTLDQGIEAFENGIFCPMALGNCPINTG